MTDIAEVIAEQLTPRQQAAALDPNREILTLACAGSGKSRTLAYRIARLLSEGIDPECIVAFTFTEKAADSIKRRVSMALDTAGLNVTAIGAMYIGTIHAYCQRILGEIDATYRQFDVLDENGLKLYLMSREHDLRLRDFRVRARGNSYFDMIKQVSDAWKTANDELLNLDDIRIADADLGNLLIQLQQRLEADQYIDFSLMIRKVVDALRNNDPRAEIATASLRHLMVDEYQDVNPCQEALIEHLHDRPASLFVVGDDDQSIYAWRGADVRNILEFPQRYPTCTVHTLSENFRSTQPIVEASDGFVSATLGPSRMPKDPISVSDRRPQDLRVLWFPDRSTEAEWVAERIEQLLGTEFEEADGTRRGLTPADFAILMRSTRQDEQNGDPRHAAFTNQLRMRNIAFSLEAGGGPFDRSQVEALRSTFELLRNAPPDRPTVIQHFNTCIVPAYEHANFDSLVRVLTEWGQLIHRPPGSTRIRLYPQKLVLDLLSAFNLARHNFDSSIMRDIGLFSRMILDVESVYVSVDSEYRFSQVLNFLSNAAESGYDVSTDDLHERPDAVTVSTVHKMKGLEFPCVFVVDVEAQRFPKRRSRYEGWIPQSTLAAAIARGAYQSTVDEEARLFYTAVTRAERYLYVSGAENLPDGRRPRRRSTFALNLSTHNAASDDPTGLPNDLVEATPVRRIEEDSYPTSFSEVRYYLECPKSYQFRERFGFNPVVPEMFGYGRTVHTAIQKLHELFPDHSPTSEEVENVIQQTFHLKHIPQSRDPVNRPGAYEKGKERAVEIATEYTSAYGNDFTRERQVEAHFEVPAANCVIAGSIDLLLREDDEGNILDAEIIDFKTIEGGEDPVENPDLEWTDLSLQVQLYAHAAEQVLGENARTGNVHLLKDGQRIEVPINDDAVAAALANVEWAVNRILDGEFPMRPNTKKCSACDFASVCLQSAELFVDGMMPPAIHIPGGTRMSTAFSEFDSGT